MSFLRDAYQPRDGIGELAAKYPDFLKSIADRHLVTPKTIGGLRQMYVLVWLCMTTREVIVSESTLSSVRGWATHKLSRRNTTCK
jgi:hypothetical protein